MKYLVTGANGFVGKNLVVKLSEIPGVEILKYLRSDTEETLEYLISQADVIIHLAGENRPIDEDAFERVNVKLTSNVCSILKKLKKKIPIIYASSKHATEKSKYGLSKLAAENLIIKYTEDCGGGAVIYRFPGIFGKWSKPNYNSVVSTFCHSISSGNKILITSPNKLINLVYIDDVIDNLILTASQKLKGIQYKSINPEYSITIRELADQISGFKKMRFNLDISKFGQGLTRALYSTYLSYLPKDDFSYAVKGYKDKRGVFVEMLKESDFGQLSYFMAPPGVTRGCHYHHSKTEKFLVVNGTGLFKCKNILTNDYYEIKVSASDFRVIDSIPGWAHCIENIGAENLIVMLWANEIFDPQSPDTVKYEI
jgi:UDP-2-acetamido-2,6-beta-L-arabino-hexul-4-ose reductase